VDTVEKKIGKNSKRIFLIRHARPKVNDKGLFNVFNARNYISDYDTAEVEEFVLEHETIPYKEIKEVFCSNLVRSQLTAKAIFGEEIKLRIDKAFREFERRIFSLPLISLPIKLWLWSARALWFLGFNNKDIETFKEARHRAHECARILIEDAQQNNTTVLVAHGLLNNFIARELKKAGWTVQHSEGHHYLSVKILQQ
jgi:broad specificity phosphatase PhoE